MATQALYRRYRPRRFSEVRGQEHIVRALRNAVIHHREGQAYLFSGPRGTGKTTSARILAKVLNCERPVEGEPCCECESCVAVERGTSYDVHELDAASNNGVDAMRDLIEKASLGTPGRHKVYILDEVHMLSKAAEAALLKTLEEPPPHVVFVLATTDPQKVSDTIRSRTQHLRFHLLPMDELEQHIRWVAADAGLDVSDAAILSALEQGGGSARDTLSALELAATTGGDDPDVVPYDEFIESLVELDAGRALTAVAHAVQHGRDPRALTEDVVRYLRDCFLSLMAPELVALPDSRAVIVAEQAGRLGAGKVVRAMERLGEILVEMRHAPDPRLLLEVALVQLTRQATANDVGALIDRIERLEQALADGGARPAAPAPTPVDPSTGRVPLGARARRDATAPNVRPNLASVPEPASTGPEPAPTATGSPSSGSLSSGSLSSGSLSSGSTAPAVPDHPSVEPTGTVAPPATATSAPAPPAAAPLPAAPPAGSSDASMPTMATMATVPTMTTRSPASAPTAAPAPAAPTPASTPAASPTPAAGAASGADDAVTRWSTEIVPALKPLVRAIFSVPKMIGVRDGVVTLGAPNDAHRAKCEQHRAAVEQVASGLVGSAVRVQVVTDGSFRGDDDHHLDHHLDDHPGDRGPATGGRHGDGRGSGAAARSGGSGTVVALHPGGVPDHDDDIDLRDLVDAPPDSVVSPIDRLAQAFPGSELLDERH